MTNRLRLYGTTCQQVQFLFDAIDKNAECARFLSLELVITLVQRQVNANLADGRVPRRRGGLCDLECVCFRTSMTS